MKKTVTQLLFILAISVQSVFAQKYEAENATLANGASKSACSSCSGGNMVALQGGNLTFTANITTAGYFDVNIMGASTGGPKTNTLDIDGKTVDFIYTSTTYSNLNVSSKTKLSAGAHTVKIVNSWGWINIDYIEFVSVSGPVFNINQSLVTPSPTNEAKCLYQFLKDNYRKKIISGAMTLNSMDEIDWLKQNTGKSPALVGIDFLQTNRGYTWYNNNTPVDDALSFYNKNGIPILCWHWRDPSRATENFYSQSGNSSSYTTFDITKVNNTSSSEYIAMISDIDFVATQLKRLQTANAAVLWRPLHEAAGGWFWWGKDGPSCKKLWQVMYDRMVNYHGLKNLIWVWTKESNDDAFYPGDNYVDIIGRDYYKTGDHSSIVSEFNTISSKFGNNKIVALSECGSFPDPDNLVADEAGWSWFMPWYGDYVRSATYNSLDLWKKAFASDYVLTLDEMPSLKTCVVTGEEEETFETASLKVFPTHVKDNLTIQSTELVEKIAIFNLAGVLQMEQNVSAHQFDISLSNLPSGAYFIKVNDTKTVKLLKE
jgi:mannan endo-1,4-beta-mannosidase